MLTCGTAACTRRTPSRSHSLQLRGPRPPQQQQLLQVCLHFVQSAVWPQLMEEKHSSPIADGRGVQGFDC
jgi:hypothetical protein